MNRNPVILNKRVALMFIKNTILDDIETILDNYFPDEKYKTYLKSLNWKNKCKEVAKRDKNHCTDCSIKVTKSTRNVHHLTYENIYNEPLEDLTLLCRDCHKKQHGLI